MSDLAERLLTEAPIWVYLAIALIVLVEDAMFVGFVVPGETAAVVGGVAASLGRVDVYLMAAVTVAAAIAGDSIGYEIGRRYGTRMLQAKVLAKRQAQVQSAQHLLATRGAIAVCVGRFVAYLRAIIPALAGTAGMPYRQFLLWNAVGGLVWGVSCVALGYLAGASYQQLASEAGRDIAVAVGLVAVVAVLVWRVCKHRRHNGVTPPAGPAQPGPAGG
ncbi:DedA family protein [Rhodococcus sp. X156]|uniref:DedA family protein n=1 Tax=Rhodococcus sp. X156 TaxID=2499145 RepID=UPI000FDA1398|nr:DedA family protein [Rhodococcus sp. X156]